MPLQCTASQEAFGQHKLRVTDLKKEQSIPEAALVNIKFATDASEGPLTGCQTVSYIRNLDYLKKVHLWKK